jgi:hypothetical protein
MSKTKTYWTDLRHSVIIGYIDGYDAVHSVLILFKDYVGQTHEDMFGPCLKGWRWDYDRSLDFSILCGKLDPEDSDRVRDYLTNTYGIPWYSNGYHDVQFFCDMMDKEDKNE